MSLPERVYTSNNHKQLSLFNDRLASEDDLREAVQKLSAAFPVPAAEQKSAAMFFAVLVERLRDNKFTGERLRAAVNHVIDNFRYKQINIADVVNFDRAARLYTCADYNAAKPSELDDFAPMYDDKLQPVRIGGVAYMIRISENPDSVLARRALAARRLQQNRREVDEEVAVERAVSLTPLGVINNDRDEVGRVHLGFLFRLEAEGAVTVRETEKLSGSFMPIAALPALRDKMEGWSQIALEVLA